MTGIQVRDFAPGDEAAFRALNEAWIQAYFTIEPMDTEVLSDPVRTIISQGGAICIAEQEGQVAGCCALLPHGPGCYEIGKMAVAEELRGQGAGKQILRYIIEKAREKGASRIYLETNDRLYNAIHLYEAAGFSRIPDEQVQTSPYKRSNVAMELFLDGRQARA